MIKKPNYSSVLNLEGHHAVIEQLMEMYSDLFVHDGFGEIRIEMKFLRRGQKEIILHCGKQYRYVLDYKQELKDDAKFRAELKRQLLA